MMFLFISCNSPFDVPADKGDKIIIKDPYLNDPLLLFSDDTLDYDMILPGESRTRELIVKNISDEPYNIDSTVFYHNYFISNNNEITIQPYSISGDSAKINIEFVSDNSGLFIDSMIIDNMYRPVLHLSAKVPYVFVRDFDFGTVNNGEIIGKIIKIENNYSDTITINTLSFEDNTFFRFSQTPQLPLKIAPFDTYDLLVRFSSNQSGKYSDSINITISENILFRQSSSVEAIVQ